MTNFDVGNGERGRKWRENEEMKRKWRDKEEMERKFLPSFHPFPISKFVTFCCKMLNTAFLSRMSQKLNIRAMRK